jgi:hypothetical protein
VQKLAAFASSLFGRLTHWLVIRNGARYVLAATLGLAVLGAVATNQGKAILPNLSAIPAALHIGDNDHPGWHGWHRHHHDGTYYFGGHHGFGGTWQNGSGSGNGGNGYVYQGGNGYVGWGNNGN